MANPNQKLSPSSLSSAENKNDNSQQMISEEAKTPYKYMIQPSVLTKSRYQMKLYQFKPKNKKSRKGKKPSSEEIVDKESFFPQELLPIEEAGGMETPKKDDQQKANDSTASKCNNHSEEKESEKNSPTSSKSKIISKQSYLPQSNRFGSLKAYIYKAVYRSK